MSRTFKLTSPYMYGNDIARFQQDLNKRAKHRGLDIISVDKQYGPNTKDSYRQVAYYLGLPEKAVNRGATPYARRLIRHPKLRNPVQLSRARKRLRGTKKRDERKEAFVNWAISKVGVTEHPPGSNRGPDIDKWQLEFGRPYLGTPYCGSFVGYGLRHKAKINVGPGMPYTPSIKYYAETGTGGFHKGVVSYDNAQVGDIPLFKFPGVSSDPVDHTGVVVNIRPGGTVETVEANTSSDASKSQNNGGEVAKKIRPRNQFVGFARPRY